MCKKLLFPFACLTMVVLSMAHALPAAAQERRPTATTGSYYLVGPSDVLEVVVWREVALSRSDILVRPDGRISLPLVDDIMAAGRTPMELKNIITKNLVQFVENPHVYVTVKEPNSQYLCVLGNVKSPGRYQMLTPTSVLQALAMAGGFNEWADKDDTIVLRGQGEDQKVLRFSYSDVVSGEETRHNFRVRPGDVIVVP